MTSWIRVPHVRKTADPTKTFFFGCDGDSLAQQFNSYFFAAVAASRAAGRLLISDSGSVLGPRTALLRQTFQDVSGVDWVDGAQLRTTSLSRTQLPRILNLLNGISQEDLRAAARQILKFNSATLRRNSELESASGIPEEIHLGIHIRSGAAEGLRHIPASAYIDAARSILSTADISGTPTVFVMADTPEDLLQFQRAADPKWNLLSMPCMVPKFASYSGPTIAALPARDRTRVYETYVANLGVLLRADHLILCMSSPVGRFLYLLNSRMKSLRSLDIQAFQIQ